MSPIALEELWDRQDSELKKHCLNTEMLAKKILDKMSVPHEVVENISFAAYYHDIGKIEIPRHILDKPGMLTIEEYEIVKQHAQLGSRIMEMKGCSPEICNIIRYHHENENGKGYYGLVSEQIPFGAKVIHICDVYDAFTSERCYHKQRSKEEALDFIKKQEGIMFDTQLVHIFLKVI